MTNEYEHKLATHPEVMAVRRAAARMYYTRYIPAAIGGLALVGASLVLHLWWWRIGLLAGIYAVVAVLIAFGIREWRMEEPTRLRVLTGCPICDERMTVQEVRSHLPGYHPEIWRLMNRSAWLLNPTAFGLLAYVLVLLSVIIIMPLPEWVWEILPIALIAPLVVYMITLAVVGVVLGRTRLQPARVSWRMLHPPRSP